MWGVQASDRYDWNNLKEKIKTSGLRNSLLLAQMPTASTAQIMGNTEAAECITSNMYNRRTSSGEFTCVNKYLVNDLQSLNMWNEDTIQVLMRDDGSVQNLEGFPDELKSVYKTCWEISQKNVIDMAADRGAYVCQSQSMNLFIAQPNMKILSSMYFYGFSKGLKTCVYYLRTKPNATAAKVALKHEVNQEDTKQAEEEVEENVCRRREECTMCSA
jgi:ribonucleoside-diphosphate reductase alpha chain